MESSTLQLLPPRRARMAAQGPWRDRTINDYSDAPAWPLCPDRARRCPALQVESAPCAASKHK